LRVKIGIRTVRFAYRTESFARISKLRSRLSCEIRIALFEDIKTISVDAASFAVIDAATSTTTSGHRYSATIGAVLVDVAPLVIRANGLLKNLATTTIVRMG